MDKLNEIKQRIQNLLNANASKDAQIASLTTELESARSRIAELEAIVSESSTTQASLDEVSTFLAERGF